MEAKKEISERIKQMSGKYTPHTIFTDFCEMVAISISNGSDLFHNALWSKREEQYLSIAKKYDQKEMKEITDLLGLLTIALEENMEDVLGWVYMDLGGNSRTGQFFTPYHLSQLLASVTLSEHEDTITLNEPSCGGGSGIIAAADYLKTNNVDFQKSLKVTAQDLDWKCVHMCYIQLSLLGIKAICVQGDSLQKPFNGLNDYPKEHVLLTPAYKGMLV